jgi:hypothetical protein
MAGIMNHAASLLATYARESKFGLRRGDYALPRERFGRAAIVADAGDHLQLPPVPKKNSLFAPLEHTSQEHRVGTSIFRNAHYVFQLKQMMRFKDDTLLRILHTMRTLGGKALADSDWGALMATETAEQSGSAGKPALDTHGWYHTCYVWSVTAMASFMEARESARKSQNTLFYIQAVDLCTNFALPSNAFAQELHRALLQVPSLTKTKRLPAYCLLHVGMQIRLTTTLEMPWAVQDATGTVLEIQWASDDQEAKRYMASASPDPEILLQKLPLAVLVRLDECDHFFLPCEPCSSCVSFNSCCPDCLHNREKLKGVFAVTPLQKPWKYDGQELQGQFINVSRRQLPLAPAKILPLYSMQGMTAEPGLVAHWVVPSRLDHDIKWLICYVILSRVPSLKQLVSIGLTDKIRKIMEGGPPQGIVQAFNTLFADKIKKTHADALEAKGRLGW